MANGLWLTILDNLGAGFTASCQASRRTSTVPKTCRSKFVHIPNFMKVWDVASDDVGSRERCRQAPWKGLRRSSIDTYHTFSS